MADPRPTSSSYALQPSILDPAAKSHAMNPVMLMINECNVIILAMRKTSRNTGSMASLLGSSDLFSGSDAFADFGVNVSLKTANQTAAIHSNDANDKGRLLEQSFVELRTILSKTRDILTVDSLTLMQPFLLTIESSSTSGYVTALALNTVSKTLQYKIISPQSLNFSTTIVQLTTSLTHCRFEASDQNTDDSLLMNVLRLLELIVISPLSTLLPNAVMSEVIHTCLCLACNKRRSEVLRRASEMAMVSITVRVFQRVRELEPESSTGEDIPANFAELNSEVIGEDNDQDCPEEAVDSGNYTRRSLFRATTNTVDLAPMSPRKSSMVESIKPKMDEQFDIQCINEFLGFLISMISPSNQFQHMESTRVFALSLINTAMEVIGDVVPEHPSLMALVADPISKDVLQIISSTDLPALLHSGLRLFCTMSTILKLHLKSQNELTFSLLFNSILPESSAAAVKSVSTVSLKVGLSKQTIIEHFSYLWSYSPAFFTEMFVDFDCDFERSDLASKFIEFLCTLSLPESAAITTDYVPPMCLDGIRSFIVGVHNRMKLMCDAAELDSEHKSIIANKLKKKAFIACTELFNEKASRGVEALYKEGFLKDSSDKKELAEFFYQKSTRLNKKVLGIYLSNPNNLDLLKEFMHLFDFSGLRVDEGLRIMLKAFRLPGESQQIERIVETFAEAFVALQNSEDGGVLYLQEGLEPVVLDSSAVFLLSFSIIMLNTDLHNPRIKRHMDLNDYERNVSGAHSFPRWYLENIYNSIRDREIVMPEEHHGTEKWFDDVWHNLISSQSKYARDHSKSNSELSPGAMSYFDKLLFESVVDQILDLLLNVIDEAHDQDFITLMMFSLDKCAQICVHYGMTAQIDRLIEVLPGFTTLAKVKGQPIGSESPISQMPTILVKPRGEDNIVVVSKTAVHFGYSLKAQLSFHVLFTIAKHPNTKVTKAWDPIVKTILTLFENCLIEPNLFGEFQKLLKLAPLSKVKPQHELAASKTNEDFGFMSTVSSLFRSYSDVSDPSDEEISATKSAINMIKLVKVPSVFESVSKRSPAEMEVFVQTLLDNVPERNLETDRFYESELMFLFEVAVCFALIVSGQDVINSVIQHLLKLSDKNELSKEGQIRLTTYFLLLARQSEHEQDKEVQKCIEGLLKLEPKDLKTFGALLVLPLISLVDGESQCRSLIHNANFWELLKEIGTEAESADEVLVFVAGIVEKWPNDIKPDNFVTLLGLLDEFSSLGAVYAHLEQGKLPKVPEVDQLRLKSLVDISKKALSLTSELGGCYNDQFDTLLQALAHQCFNPCREVRNYAMYLLRRTILSSGSKTPQSTQVIFDFGLFPLLAELEKEQVLDTDRDGFSETQLHALTLLSKAFLMFHDKLEKTVCEKIWSGIVRCFVVFDKLNVDNPHHKIFKEQSLEDMKNMILVLQYDFLQHSNSELWESTWNELDILFPGLKEEITPATPQEQKPVEPLETFVNQVSNLNVVEDEETTETKAKEISEGPIEETTADVEPEIKEADFTPISSITAV